MHRAVLLVFFFLSGISGLIYQIAWVRQASLTFGVSVYAYSTVLAAYMIGMGLGSYVMGRRADARARPLRTYALLEVGIAVLAGISPFLLTSLNGVYADFSQAFEPGLGLLTLLRLVLSILVLTPATFLIGATLPVMSRIYATRVGWVGRDVGRLYLVNTAGAALGCLLAGIVLMRLLGMRETILLAASVNLLVAAGAMLLDRFSPATAASDSPDESLAGADASPEDSRRGPPEPGTLSPGALRFVGIGYAISGFIALGYEVVWARILYIHTSHAVYSFSLMLTVFLSGLAVGSAVGTRWLQKHRATLAQFGVLQLGISLLAVLILFTFAFLPSLHVDDLVGDYGIRYELGIAFITMFPPTLLLGVLFPIVSSLYSRERTEDVGLRIGTVNAMNTVGAILGSLLVGFVLVPFLGLRNTTLFLAALNLAIGAGALWLTAASAPRLRWAPVPVLGLAIAAVFVMPAGLYLGSYADAEEYLIFYEEGPETTVAVLEVPEDNFKISFVNGRDEVPTDPTSMVAFRLLGHLPALLRPGARNALMLSFGNGIATGTLNTHEIPVIDAVDLSREMIKAAALYSEENHNVLDSPRLNLYVEDARNFLLRSPDRYDIITTDATHPANASSWALFTLEFYELVREHLSADGVFMQWLPIHGLTQPDYRDIIRTFGSVFPNTTLWSTGGTHSYLVATPQPLTTPSLEQFLAPAADSESILRELGPPSIIGGYVAMAGGQLATYVGFGRAVTDNTAFFLPIR